LKYRLSLPQAEDVNDPDGVYRSTLLDFDNQIYELRDKIAKSSKFPDDLDVLPPFPDDHIEKPPPSPLNPPLSRPLHRRIHGNRRCLS
jgi:hypothetical protein